MRGKIVTCRKATRYPGMLARGKQYKILDFDEKKDCIKIVCDNGRTRLFDRSYFDMEGKPVEMLVNWKFYDNIEDVKRGDFLSWVEVSFRLSDGTTTLCKLYTPELLTRVLSQPNIIPPGMYIPNIILVRSLEKSDVDKLLRYLDDEDELIKASLLLGYEDDFEDLDLE